MISSQVAAALELLFSASHPLIVIGKGASISCCESELLEFVNRMQIPFLPTPMGRGVIGDDHTLCVSAERSRVMKECDVALLLGCRLNWILHFGEKAKWNANVQFIVVDLDPTSSDKVYPMFA